MTSPLRHPLHAMSMSMSPSAGRASRGSPRTALHSPRRAQRQASIGTVAGAVNPRWHTGAACMPAVISTPLPESP